MAFTEMNGTAGLRDIFIDKTIKALTEPEYKFKQALSIENTSSWTTIWFREDPSVLDAVANDSIDGVPRGAALPNVTTKFEQKSNTLSKFGAKDRLFWEDIKFGNIDIQRRTLFKIAQAIAKKVDDKIYYELTTGPQASGVIQTISLSAGYQWDNVSASIVDNLEEAAQKIFEANFPIDNLLCFVNPKDKRSVAVWITDRGSQFPNFSTEIAQNGRFAKLDGIQFVVSNSVPASESLIVCPQLCGTWKVGQSLQTYVQDETPISLLIQAVEVGDVQLYAPKAVVRITNTQK